MSQSRTESIQYNRGIMVKKSVLYTRTLSDYRRAWNAGPLVHGSITREEGIRIDSYTIPPSVVRWR
jgi:hypothetical protein